MTPNRQREEISKAYVAAVAARCGFKLGEWSQDDGCLDSTIAAAGVLGGGTLSAEPGSYLTPILVPVSPAMGKAELEDPFSRRVTKLLAHALMRTVDALAAGDDDRLLEGAASGLSSNFLAALAELRPPGSQGHLDVSFAWAARRPAPEARPRIRLEHGPSGNVQDLYDPRSDRLQGRLRRPLGGPSSSIDRDLGARRPSVRAAKSGRARGPARRRRVNTRSRRSTASLASSRRSTASPATASSRRSSPGPRRRATARPVRAASRRPAASACSRRSRRCSPSPC